MLLGGGWRLIGVTSGEEDRLVGILDFTVRGMGIHWIF